MRNEMKLSFLIDKMIVDECLFMDSRKVNILIQKLRAIPLEVQMDDLRISHSKHVYGFNHRVEVFEFFAHPHSYHEFGLFLLVATLITDAQDRLIHLTNEDSKIKTIRILGNSDQIQNPDFSLEFAPNELKKHPWENVQIDAWDLPIFNRTNASDFPPVPDYLSGAFLNR